MKKATRFASVVLAAVLTFSLAGCGSSDAGTSSTQSSKNASGKTYTIGICQLVQHEALDAATQGFKDALTDKLGDNVKFDEQNAAGDAPTCSTICTTFATNNYDLPIRSRYLEHPLPIMQQRSTYPTGPVPLAEISPEQQILHHLTSRPNASLNYSRMPKM